MYTRHKIILALIWLLGLAAACSCSLTYSIDVSGQLISVLSIFFGFYVTSAALVATSRIYSDLHKKEDFRGDRRLSQTLVAYYGFGFVSLLLGIVFFIMVSAFTAGGNMSISPIAWPPLKIAIF